jgi:hypothetical protein
MVAYKGNSPISSLQKTLQIAMIDLDLSIKLLVTERNNVECSS